jgi:hypothetical protein
MKFNFSFKSYQYLLLIICLFSCSKEKVPQITDPFQNLRLVTSISNNTHIIDLYSGNGKFQTGYNNIYLQIKDKAGNAIDNATVSWTPMMNMTMMSHSCPKSEVMKSEDAKNVYRGYIIFQMPGTEAEYWELTLDYTINGVSYTAKGRLNVEKSSKRVVETFQANDNKNYVLALVEPQKPKVAVNEIKALLFQMESMASFTPVKSYKIKIDPRMPGMGNHSSPNNVDLTDGANDVYEGRLSLTMTGYWKINLILEDAAQNAIKGELVSQANESSSIYFEIEF